MKPIAILPTDTEPPRSMLINIGDIIPRFKRGNCPVFKLLIFIGDTVVYNDSTFGQCQIQTLYNGQIEPGEIMMVLGTADGYYPINYQINLTQAQLDQININDTYFELNSKFFEVGLNGGQIAGIVIGSVLVLALIIVLLVVCLIKTR